MAQQNEILRQLVQRQPPPQHYGGGDHQRHPAAATYQEFLSTQPPLFTRAEDPLDADVWLPCSQRIERWNGGSSRQLSGDTTYQPGLWTESSTNFWHSLRVTGQCCSMPRLLMTCASMLGIMQIRTRRRETCSGGGSALSSVTVLTPSEPTATTSWSTWLSPRRTALQLDSQKRRGRPLWQDPQLSHSASGLCSTHITGDPSSSKEDG
jgi:hypothetical protein